MQLVHSPTLVLALLVGAAAQAPSMELARVCALRFKSLPDLKAICQKAGLDVAADADEETLRAALYDKMQEEKPEYGKKPWPGPGEAGECDEIHATLKKQGAGAPGAAATAESVPPMSLNGLAGIMFSRMDKDADGMLSRAELTPLIKQVNAAARAKGEPEHDLFATLDRNKDDFVSRAEAENLFKSLAAGKKDAVRPDGAGSPEAGLAADDMASTLFNNLDVNKDGRLSKEEFEPILEKHEADARARGEEPGDFWSTMDIDKDDYVTQEEAETFFRGMAAALEKGTLKTAKEEL